MWIDTKGHDICIDTKGHDSFQTFFIFLGYISKLLDFVMCHVEKNGHWIFDIGNMYIYYIDCSW
jgi:hypothetical protein